MTFSKATLPELDAVFALYENAVRRMAEDHIFQWDAAYPSKAVIKNDISREQLYMTRLDREIASVFVLNAESEPEYAEGQWRYPQSSYAVVHRLCVNPSLQRRGLGRRTVRLIEAILKGEGVESVRLDAFSGNPAALHMYEQLGYQRVGSVHFRLGRFYLLEKSLYEK
jgi:ribosomal protein S18 acetylase RimI-like enzyme